MKRSKSTKKKARKSSAVGAGSSDSLLTDDDLHWFNEGTHTRLYERLGAHVRPDGAGVYFAVWAPNAASVSLMGDFNGWDKSSHPLTQRGNAGIWEGSFPGLGKGALYKYHIRSRLESYAVDKADPFGFHHETPPRTGSIVWDLDYQWNDASWMATRNGKNSLDAPMSIYEMHLGSWRRGDGSRWLSYRELAPLLAEYAGDMGFTHVELLPVMEHPFFGSWGYQTTGYFAPTSRFGTPQDFMYLIDVLHQSGVGVILDWVPSHFPGDEHGLAFFDGTYLYEHADPRKGFHPDWKSFIFNYGRKEVQSFLLSSAIYWLDNYHVDGLRVDAVASMLYLDYSRDEGEWIPNKYGGRENLEAIAFLRRFNEVVYESFPDVETIAEESTSWPMVSRPTYLGGLGFGLKWDMGFMHDSLKYMQLDPIFRKFQQNELTFRMLYAFHENFLLPFSHDEVVHGKGSMLRKMSGDEWQKFANLRALLGYMYGQPGKKLLFMGAEIAQWNEWYHESSLDWGLLEEENEQRQRHLGMQNWVRDLNHLYRVEPALHERDCRHDGFEWIDCTDVEHSILSFIRRGETTEDVVLAAFNFTPVPRHNYRLGVPRGGLWKEALNSDAISYGGSGEGNLGGIEAAPLEAHGREYSIDVLLPPLGAVFFKNEET